MDRLRRSIRDSFRRKPKERSLRSGSLVDQSPIGTPQPGGSGTNGPSAKAELWLPDEAAVRDGTCSFNVKYLGGIEVFESRGMQVCEGALKLLRAQRRRPVKAILYVSGDGLRVVDQENNRGLIVDQTIEKVSFCAPDRNHEKGFAYICRDGSSRRWMCHGFHASKESGERLSHAVGCAFAVCLEKKKKRDEEATLAVRAAADLLPPPAGSEGASTSAGFTLKALPTVTTAAPMNGSPANGFSTPSQDTKFERSNAAYSSFRRQLSITERLRDPQTAILQEPPPVSQVASSLHISSKPRPAANPLLFERQGSLRAPQSSSAEVFRRQFSLRSYSSDLSGQAKSRFGNGTLRPNEPIIEGDEESNWPETSSACRPGVSSAQIDHPPHVNGFSTTSLSQSMLSSPTTKYQTMPAIYSSQGHTPDAVSVGASRSSKENSPARCGDGSFPARSRADEWLEQTLKTSLSISSSLSADTVTRNSYIDGMSVGPPPAQPPPPLPPKSILFSPAKPVNTGYSFPSTSSAKKFDSDFSRYELPPITEAFTVTTESIAKSSAGTLGNVDIFGQPIFNPMPSSSFQNSVSKSESSGSLNNYLGVKSDDSDPFDVKWSEMVISSTSGLQQTPIKSTNPFFNELSAVRTQ